MCPVDDLTGQSPGLPSPRPIPRPPPRMPRMAAGACLACPGRCMWEQGDARQSTRLESDDQVRWQLASDADAELLLSAPSSEQHGASFSKSQDSRVPPPPSRFNPLAHAPRRHAHGRTLEEQCKSCVACRGCMTSHAEYFRVLVVPLGAHHHIISIWRPPWRADRSSTPCRRACCAGSQTASEVVLFCSWRCAGSCVESCCVVGREGAEYLKIGRPRFEHR